MSLLRRAGRATLPLVLCLLAGRPALAEECTDAALRDPFACREIVVEYDPLTFDWGRIIAVHHLRLAGLIPALRQAWFEAPDATSVPALLAAIAAEPGVIEAEPNEKFVSPECRHWSIELIPFGPDARPLYQDQPALATLNLPDRPQGLGAGTLVAVLDTGIALGHPDLPSTVRGHGIDLIGGVPDADDRGNGLDDDGDLRIDEGVGHGTAVAGLVHAVAPAATLLPVRVLDDECRGTAFAFAAGIVRAVDAGARVINVSLGAYEGRSVLVKAIRYARDRGAVVVAPGGNEADEFLFPADESSVVAVAAVDDGLVAPAWTAHSSKVAFVAPGVDVMAPRPGGGYAQVSGTSFSTALVSGALAAAAGDFPELDGRDLARLVEDNARSVDGRNPELDGELGAGVPDVGALHPDTPLPRLGNVRRVLPGGVRILPRVATPARGGGVEVGAGAGGAP